MEKELTGEEVIKALTYCCDGNGYCGHREDCPLRNESACTTVLARYSLDLINRQKAEIERLTEYAEMFERDEIGSPITMDKMLALEKDKIELQKQVDELMEENQKLQNYNDKLSQGIYYGNGEQFCNRLQQTVKDTAKEILQAIKDDKHGYWDSCDCGKEELHWSDKSINGTLLMLAKRYGVEVE